MLGSSLSVGLQFPVKIIPLKKQYSGSKDLTAGKCCYARKLFVTVNDGDGNITASYKARLVYNSAKREPDYIKIISRFDSAKISLSKSGEPQDVLFVQSAKGTRNGLPFKAIATVVRKGEVLELEDLHCFVYFDESGNSGQWFSVDELKTDCPDDWDDLYSVMGTYLEIARVASRNTLWEIKRTHEVFSLS